MATPLRLMKQHKKRPTTMTRHRYIIRILAIALTLLGGATASAQFTTTMVNGDTIFIDACQIGSGVIYDDGGPTSPYSNSFLGQVVIQAAPGATITLSGMYNTESSSFDWINIWDGEEQLMYRTGGTGGLNVTATSGSLTLEFRTDGSVTRDGFALEWTSDGGTNICANSISALTATNVTDTSIDFSWSASGSGPFYIYADGRKDSTDGTSFHLDNLSPNQSYGIRVIAKAEDSNFCCADYIRVRTLCGLSTLPFNEDFEDYVIDSFPNCWLLQVNFDDPNYTPRIDGSHHHNGSRSLMLSCGGNNTGDHFGLVATGSFYGTGERTTHLHLMASHANTVVEVGVCDSNGSEYNSFGFTPITTLSLSTTWADYRVDWTATAPGQRLALRMVQSMQNGTGRFVYIDDIGTEGCGVDSLTASHIDYDRLTLSWTTFNNPTCTITVRDENSTVDTLTFENAVSPLDITGLHASHTYTFSIWPSCDNRPSVGRSVTVTMPATPTDANLYCSPFRTTGGIPNGWTTYNVGNSYFGYDNNRGAIYCYSNSTALVTPCFLISDRMINLAGKRVLVQFAANTSGKLLLGTMEYADDLSTFTQLGTLDLGVYNTAINQTYYNGLDHTVCFDIPDSSSARHLAIGFTGSSWSSYYISAIEIGDSTELMGDQLRIHRRGSKVELQWDTVHNTVLVEHGLHSFTPGTGTIDTFYNAQRGTVENLNFSTDYDFYIYLPNWHPCRDRVVEVRTATNDYPMPWCEDFNTLYNSAWNSTTGDWVKFATVNNAPTFSDYAIGSGRTLEFASWGIPSYNSTAIIPDIEIGSEAWLSFYITDYAPSSTIRVMGLYAYSLGSQINGISSWNIASIPINATSGRRHYVLHLDSSQTYDNQIALQYEHPYPYYFYRSYIDDLHIAHSAYGEIKPTYVGYDSASFCIDSLYGTDSVEVTLISTADTHSVAVSLADIDSISINNLQPGTYYWVHVRPFDGGCPSYALNIITRSNPALDGSGYVFTYADCFSMDDVLSYELPIHWASEGNHEVTLADELQFQANTTLATHPMQGLSGLTLSFRARSTSPSDTLRLGIYPGDSISTDSTHFSLVDSLFSVTDTMLTDTTWNSFALEIHDVPTGKWRLCFQAGNGDVLIDDIGISSCPMVHFEADGNDIICTMDNSYTSYYLTIDDSAGTDHRVLKIDVNPFRVIGTKLSTKYTLSWRCRDYQPCEPQTTMRTDDGIPLPYCEYFNQSYSNIHMPSTWSVAKGNPYDTLAPSTLPSLYMNPTGTKHWFYVILPLFYADSALSVYLEAYTNNYTFDSNQLQLGVLTNGTDTSSFIPLYSNPFHTGSYGYTFNASADFSAYTDKHVAIRCNSSVYLRNLRAYGLPLPKYSLPHAGTLKVSSTVDKSYWIEQSSPYKATRITSNPQIINIGTGVYSIRQTADSLGGSCENYTNFDLKNTISTPYCYSAYRYLYRDSWYIMNELPTPTLDGVTLRLTYSANENDTVLVGILTDALDINTFTVIDTITGGGSAIVDLSSYTDTGRWIGFYNIPTSSSGSIYINEIQIESCPGAISASASLYRWNQIKIDAHAVPFYVEYYPTGTFYQGNPGNTIVKIDSVPFILTLNPETQYRLHYKCDSLSSSCRSYSDIKTLSAPLDVPSCIDFDTIATETIPQNWTRKAYNIAVKNNRSHSGTKSLSIPIGSNAYAITPDVNIDSLKRITMSVWYYTEDPSDRLVVGVMKDPYDMNTYHPVRTMAPGVAGTWQRGLIEFSSIPNDAYFIVLQAKSNHQPESRSIYVDDIYLDTSIAYDLYIKDINSGSITLDWKQVGNPDVTITIKDGNNLDSVFTHATPPLQIEPISMLHYYTILFNSVCNSGDDGYCNTNISDSLSVIAPAPGVGCINATDLNSAQAVFYSGNYSNPYSTTGAINYGSFHPDSRHTVCYDTAARDPRTGNLLRTIPEGYTSSVRLGNWSTNTFDPEAEGVIYSLYVDTTSFELLLLRYAAVLQDPMHASADQPRFRMELLDSNFNLIDPVCTSADFIADQSLGWNSASDGVLWKDWTSVGIDLSAHAGEQVYFRLTTYDCNEGNHYGYAYFTLECMRKNMNTESCGDVVTNTLRAPEGFHYRWYTSDDPTTVSTEQSITVPSQDITYFCDVSKIDNDNCFFSISAYGGTRYPMAAFDTSVAFTDFQFHVSFSNESTISNDGINPIAGTECESALWTFGNGESSSNYHGSAVYPDTGTFLVQLVSGIAYNQCQDTTTMLMKLEWPDYVVVKDSVICSDQLPLMWNDSVFTSEGSKFRLFTAHDGSDSVLLMRVYVVDVPTITVSNDTTIFCGDTASPSAVSSNFITWYDEAGSIAGSGTTVNVSPASSTHYVAASVNTNHLGNVVYNGYFESGNTGFSSGYTFKTDPNDALPEGQYDICTNAYSTHGNFSSCGDHTTGSGNYLVVNGATVPNTIVWSQTVNVKPHTEYAFSAWVNNVTTPGLNNEVAYLQFMINGVQVGPIFSCLTTLKQWANYYEVWNSGDTTTATIAIVNQNTIGSGNDFGIDDISLAPTMCHVYDTVAIHVIQTVDTFVCENYLPLTWNSHVFTSDSVAWDTLTAQNGMDSIVRYTLHVKHNSTSTVYDTVVENSLPYTRFGLTYSTDVADSLAIITNMAGCDSLISYNLHVHWNVATSVDSTTCLINLPLIWNNVVFDTTLTTTSTMTRSVTYATWGGADSVVTMNLTVVPNPLGTLRDTIVENQLPYNYRGHILDTTVTDTVFIFAGSQLCDSIITYSLHVWMNRDTTLYNSICSSTLPYTWEGYTFTTADQVSTIGLNKILKHDVLIPTSHGADSTLHLELTVRPSYDTVDTLIICPWAPYAYRGVDYGGPSVFDTVFYTSQNCDSVVHVVLRPRDTSFHIEAYYHFNGNNNWELLDSSIIGCTPDTLYIIDSTANTFDRQWLLISADTILNINTASFEMPFMTGRDSLSALLALQVKSEGECWDTAAWPIVMFTSPVPEFEWSPTNPPMHNPEATFFNLTYQPDSLRYLWNIQSAVGGSYDTSTLFAPFYHWGNEGENMVGDYRVVLTAYWDRTIDTLLHGDWYDDSLATIFHYLLPSLHYPITHTCIDSTENIITITNDYLQFPNMVSPNGDGNNDIWKVVNLLEFGNYSMNELWIYDRWGVLVYHVKNITKEEQFWDPNNTHSPDGTYYYRFIARSLHGAVKRNGVIEVLRD